MEPIEKIFSEFDKKIKQLNTRRRKEDLFSIKKTEIKLLGQMSLLANKKVCFILSLTQTVDIDALLVMEQIAKEEFKKILKKYGFIYDEDSYLIWIPKGAIFEILFDFEYVRVECLDPESALVSKAVKAPKKNLQLIRQAIASEKFPNLIDRILENKGKLEDFI